MKKQFTQLLAFLLVLLLTLSVCGCTTEHNDLPDSTSGTTSPENTEPPSTTTEVTVPETTVPDVTEPPVTEPPVTEPPVDPADPVWIIDADGLNNLSRDLDLLKEHLLLILILGYQ